MDNRILCFGGSFNPIHHGHLICARAVAEARHYDRVALVVASTPPHKAASDHVAPAADRLEMCRLATQGSQLLQIEDIELKRPGPSFTIDTVIELASRGWGRIHWLIGADMLNYLPKWHQIDELIAKVEFVIIGRPGLELDWDRLPAGFQHLRKNVVETPLIDITATDIRFRVSEGLSIDYLTPEPVCRYVQQRGLYR